MYYKNAAVCSNAYDRKATSGYHTNCHGCPVSFKWLPDSKGILGSVDNILSLDIFTKGLARKSIYCDNILLARDLN